MAMFPSITPVVTEEEIAEMVTNVKAQGKFTPEQIAQILIDDVPPSDVGAMEAVRMRNLVTGEVMEEWTADIAAHVVLNGDTWLIFETGDTLNVSAANREISARVYLALTT